MRIGLGYDNHRLIPGRPLLLGGVAVPSPVGEDAHSDGDVLIHALVDALLGAIGAGDIGTHFPDTDPRWKGQASSLFLEEAARMVRQRGMGIGNINATVILEKVKLQGMEDGHRGPDPGDPRALPPAGRRRRERQGQDE